MQRLSTDLVRQACAIFLSLAYPGGEASTPEKRRRLLHLPSDRLMVEQIAGDAPLQECCQVIPAQGDAVRMVLIRLGCCHYPNLKLKVQLVGEGREADWLFGVDTHDSFSANCFLPPPDHPDAAAWRKLQADNAALKQKIEAAWDHAGLLTFNGLLRRDLPKCRPSLS
jgi:hypothetical protein